MWNRSIRTMQFTSEGLLLRIRYGELLLHNICEWSHSHWVYVFINLFRFFHVCSPPTTDLNDSLLPFHSAVFLGGQFVSGCCYLKAGRRTVFLGSQPVADCCYLETVLILSANKTVFLGGQFVSGCCRGGVGAVVRSLPLNPKVSGSIPGLAEGWISVRLSSPLKFTQLSILPRSVKWAPAYMDRIKAAARCAYMCFRFAGGKLIIVMRLWAYSYGKGAI